MATHSTSYIFSTFTDKIMLYHTVTPIVLFITKDTIITMRSSLFPMAHFFYFYFTLL